MREILFRGKTDKGEWVEGSAINTQYDVHGERHVYIGVLICFKTHPLMQTITWYEVDPETVGQFTGLTDKNGKKIFEGDIVECFSSDYAGRPKKDTIKVKDITDYNTMVYLNCSNELEIIGNIHDNPEHLEKE